MTTKAKPRFEMDTPKKTPIIFKVIKFLVLLLIVLLVLLIPVFINQKKLAKDLSQQVKPAATQSASKSTPPPTIQPTTTSPTENTAATATYTTTVQSAWYRVGSTPRPSDPQVSLVYNHDKPLFSIDDSLRSQGLAGGVYEYQVGVLSIRNPDFKDITDNRVYCFELKPFGSTTDTTYAVRLQMTAENRMKLEYTGVEKCGCTCKASTWTFTPKAIEFER